MMDPFALILIFAGAALLCGAGIARLQVERGLRDRLNGVVRQTGLSEPALAAVGGAQSWLFRLGVAVGRRVLGGAKARDALGGNLRRAGIQFAGAAEAFAALRLLTALMTGTLAALLLGEGTTVNYTAVAAIGALVGAFATTRLLSMIAGRREQAIRKELPVTLDLLCLALEGGAGIEQGLRFLAQPGRLPAKVVIGPLRALVADLDHGVPHDLALERLGDRLGIEPALLFVEVLRQSLRHGTDVVPALKALAEDLTERRIQEARASIGRIATTMTVVMVICFIPALMILIAAPSIGSLTTLLRGMLAQQ
ncbi:type II secretion system F family protein [Plastoroseomonas hellenica]|uniref:type II secretion system F family protein n=1 Tax=Plastoroseomonas hellenica TaxID=2687306 RepID=UPI001BA8741A|nr:type II secretion system F family protein [Plastoroseomonas hellenica]MBR0646324.1 type II secretion system F family protein [Plastoroseomonas hellenica]